MKYLGKEGVDIEYTSIKEELKEENEFDHWFMKIGDGLHDICGKFGTKGTKTVIGKVLRKVYGEEYQDEPIPNVQFYWDIVKKWYEHPIPVVKKGGNSLTKYIPVYSYFYPKSMNGEPVAPVIYQITEKTMNKDKYLLPQGKTTRNCELEELIPINEEDELNYKFTLRDTQKGKRLFIMDTFTESYIHNNPDKIFGYELCDCALDKYWQIGNLNQEEYIVDNYVA